MPRASYMIKGGLVLGAVTVHKLFEAQLLQQSPFLKVGNVVMLIHLACVRHGPKNNTVYLSIFLLQLWAQVSPLRCA